MMYVGRRVMGLCHPINMKRHVMEFKQLAKQHGIYFLIYAAAIELIERVLLPIVLIHMGYAYLSPAALFLHTEVVLYPFYFVLRRGHRRLKKRLCAVSI